jgi:hypothetical protein
MERELGTTPSTFPATWRQVRKGDEAHVDTVITFSKTNDSTGKTSVLHDSESPTDVGHCPDPGCYSREIVYSATMRQITTLVELSDECHQSIKVSHRIESLEKIKPMQIKDA